MSLVYRAALEACDKHAGRLKWAMARLNPLFPLQRQTFDELSNEDVAALDQFVFRFAKLQDAMGMQLFPAVLELTKDASPLVVFIDKLNRLEKMGAIPSVEQWLLLREMRNSFAHDYPDDPDLQVSALNRALELARELLAVLEHIRGFATRYL